MPRKRKPAGPETQGGYAAQPVTVPTGQGYGEAKAQRESQQAAPLASVSGQAGPGGSAPVPLAGASAPSGPQQQGSPLERALQMAGLVNPPPPLNAPSTRPNEPVTAGMRLGPGGGPELLRTGDRVARTIARMAEASGDPMLAQLADVARART